MWQLLSWLYERAWEIYEFFGENFASYLNAVRNAWNWAVDRATWALNIAKTYIKYYYNLAKYYADLLYDEVYRYAENLVSTLQTLVKGWVNTARAYAEQLYNTAIDYINKVIDDAKAVLASLIQAAESLAQTLVDGLKNWVISWAGPIVSMYGAVTTLWTALAGSTLQRLVAIAQHYYSMLTIFLDNPVGFIYAYLRGSFLTFLSYLLGYALGTEEASLPPWPVWGVQGEGGPEAPPGPPQTEEGYLAKPVVPLWISGYTFGPGHYAVDYGLTMGQAVYAAHSGVIEVTKYLFTGLGHYVTIRGNHWWTLYAHLQDIYVSPGQSVKQGDIIGTGDSTGYSTGPHLHFAVKRDGIYVDPVTVIK